ncbi:MAG: carboxylating nicotinate-nucleotide diphosphorylase [Saprospiraceae bacterium]
MLDEAGLQAFIEAALAEDVGDGDHTSLACIPGDSFSDAILLVKDVGVIAGVELAKKILLFTDPNAQIEVLIEDGADVDYKDIVFTCRANTRALLKAERLLLNCMQRMSGIATLSSRFAVEVEGSGVTILDTRKTSPLIRFMEKWAVRIGGCTNYREGLYDWIMIKDNHVEASGGIIPAIERVHKYLDGSGLHRDITVEVRNLVELHEVLQIGGVKRIMFDNFELPILKEAVATVNGRFETEASGGVNLHTVASIARTGVQFISVGALTHSAGSLDLSFKIQ